MTTVALLKYHGLGNDFLVALDPVSLPGGAEAEPGFVRAACDRHRGFGADGLVVARPPSHGGDVAMELRNADGSRAETSGNGLRCLALALRDAGLVTSREMTVETDGGTRRCVVGERSSRWCAEVRVEMGPVVLEGEVPPPAGLARGWRAFLATTGNPHLVLVGGGSEALDLAAVGPALEAGRPGGQNVEAVRVAGDALDLSVWERGAGLTQACGSGSVAAAAVARSLGLVADRVLVRNPGGPVLVTLREAAGELLAEIEGPACRVGRVELELEAVT